MIQKPFCVVMMTIALVGWYVDWEHFFSMPHPWIKGAKSEHRFLCDMVVFMASLLLVPLFFKVFSGLFFLGCPCWQLPMLTRRPDHTRLQSSVCMGGFRVYTISNGVLDVLFHVSNHTFQQSQSLFYVCGSMPFPFSISIACLVKASQEDRNNLFKSTTSQQPPMTVMQHWNKGPPTGTHLHIPLTPKVL